MLYQKIVKSNKEQLQELFLENQDFIQWWEVNLEMILIEKSKRKSQSYNRWNLSSKNRNKLSYRKKLRS